MYNQSVSSSFTNCTFTDNSAKEAGGGMYNRRGSPSLTHCTFSGNSAVTSGGGMCNEQSDPTLTNCTFTGNSANEDGGGMLNQASSSPTLSNCTFSGNSANEDGGGMYNNDNSSPTVTNCILWGNAASSGAQIYNDGTSSATVSYSDIQDGWRGTGNTNADPLFIDAGGGDLHLSPGSPCIDAGDPFSYFGLEPEPDGARINMGAYGNTPEATCKGGLVLKSYNMVSKVRSGRTTFKYEFTVTLSNNSTDDIHNLQLEMLDASGSVVMLDSEVNFGHIAAGETATSEDTFSLSVDRAIPIDATTISWRAKFESGVSRR